MAAAEKHNVLVIHTDQHRAECLGCAGNADIRTPNIDRIAGDGLRFSESYCPFPVCTPSRYSLLSGLYVHQHRGWTNHCTLPPGTPTFASVLRDAGYHTKAVGKMHFTPTYLDLGFDEMRLSEQDGPGRWDDDYHRYLRDLKLVDRIDVVDQRREYRQHAPEDYWRTFGAAASDLPEEHHSTTWIGDRAVETLHGWEGSGNLLMAGFIKPHHPFDPPAPWDAMYDPDALTLLPGWIDECPERDLAFSRGYFPHDELTEPALRRIMAHYYATISHIDHQVGRMLAVLDERGLYDDTLIVFTADHGEYLGDHHLLLKANHLYDSVTRVPLILKAPGATGGGAASDALVSNVDVAPTIIGCVGERVPEGMTGYDLLRHPAGREVVLAEYGPVYAMARTRDRKLLAVGGPEGAAMLFDLERDPRELDDVSADPAYQGDLARLRQEVHYWRKEPVPGTYLDEYASTIAGDNVPPRDLSHREDIAAYYWHSIMGEAPMPEGYAK
jgi:arylsulfatase